MIGQTLSHYKVLSKLGEGGMGAVYMAEDIELGRQVALKVLPEEMAESPERLERFRREARAIAALDHPSIIRIHNFEEAAGLKLLVMELVDGDSLDRIIPPGGMPLGKVFSIAVPMADALATAHEKGITHRDLKPANVMVRPDGSIKVLDFGLAKVATDQLDAPVDEETALATATAALTTEGVVMGTAPYMSPEQLQGKPVDPRTDIFSLGVVLYEMVTGERPFQGESGIDLASRILRETPSAVSDIRTDLPRHLGRIVQRCLEKDPERRYQSAKDVRNELEGLQREIESGPVATGSGPIVAAPSSGAVALPGSGPAAAASDPGSVLPSGAQPATTGSRLRLWGGIAAALVVVAAGAWWIGRGGQSSTAPTTDARGGSARPTAPVADTVPSVAVLPFLDLSPQKDQEYFTDGMTEELLYALDNIEGLKVPSRTAVFALKGKNLDIGQVGERLGVSTVLEGSVRKAGDRLRITAQLVKVEDGFRMWTETYDRRMDDVFSVQNEIAQSIAAALEVTLTATPSAGSELGGTGDTEAYDFFLRGMEYGRRSTKEDTDYAIRLFERAVAIDPDYALAWAAVANQYANRHLNYGGSGSDMVAAERASRKALDLAPDLSVAHSSRAFYLTASGQDEESDQEYEEALRLGPEDFRAHWSYGQALFRRGEFQRAANLWEKASVLDPEDPRPLNLLPQVYNSLGQAANAQDANRRKLAWVERYLELNPDDLRQVMIGATSLLELGERERAFEWAQQVLEAESDDTLVLYNNACFFSMAGETEKALDALEKAVEAGDRDAAWWRQDSDLDNVRDDPRFAELLARMEAEGP